MQRFGCHNLTISYDRHPIIHHASCEFHLGTTTAIIGPNGAGKSTFLNGLMGILNPNSGHVIMDEISFRDIAYLPQIHDIDNMIPLKVKDVVLLGDLFESGMFKSIKERKYSVNECLEKVGLSKLSEKYIADLSRGQLQRVLLARIIFQNASIILLDEPFNAMDAVTTKCILELIQQWVHDGKTVIAVLHDFAQVAKHFEYTVLLAKNFIFHDATKIVLKHQKLKELYSNPISSLVDDLNLNKICEME